MFPRRRTRSPVMQGHGPLPNALGSPASPKSDTREVTHSSPGWLWDKDLLWILFRLPTGAGKESAYVHTTVFISEHIIGTESLVSSLRQRVLNNSSIHTSAHSAQNLRGQEHLIESARTTDPSLAG